MIVAMENFIPDRLAASSEKKSPLDPPRKSMPPHGFASSRPQPIPDDPQPSPLPGHQEAHNKMPLPHLSRQSRLGGKSASGPWPRPVDLRQPL